MKINRLTLSLITLSREPTSAQAFSQFQFQFSSRPPLFIFAGLFRW